MSLIWGRKKGLLIRDNTGRGRRDPVHLSAPTGGAAARSLGGSSGREPPEIKREAASQTQRAAADCLGGGGGVGTFFDLCPSACCSRHQSTRWKHKASQAKWLLWPRADWMTGWMTGWLAGWLSHRMTRAGTQLADKLRICIDRSIDRLTGCDGAGRRQGSG